MEKAIENGGEEVIDNGDHFEIQCAVNDFHALTDALTKQGIESDSAEIVYIPSNLVKIEDKDRAQKIIRLVEALDDLEDVKSVFSNYDIDDSLLD